MSDSNKHFIVGEDRRCLCGIYNDKPICCADIMAALESIVGYSSDYGVRMQTPGLRQDAELVQNVLMPLLQECE